MQNDVQEKHEPLENVIHQSTAVATRENPFQINAMQKIDKSRMLMN
jgi:hypothetical protein